MTDLHLCLVQNDLAWEDTPSNLSRFDDVLANVHPKTDVIILPEMFSTGFTNNAAALAVPMDSAPVRWMQNHASMLDALIIGSMIISESGKYFNRLLAVFPNGQVLHYDKRHLFSLMQEQDYYQAGSEQLIFEFRGWKLFPLICYDLRFPVWCRNTALADLMIFVANWPEKREEHWTTLLKARAIENQCYVAGVNRVGLDDKANNFNGQSAVYDFWGNIVASAGNLPGMIHTTLSKTELEAHRKRYTFWKDRDTFELL
jgi:omega-amidase